jgi:hypothetical protein
MRVKFEHENWVHEYVRPGFIKSWFWKKYKSFSRNGANLPEGKKEILREIDKE